MVTLILTIDIMMMKIYFQAPMDLIMKERDIIINIDKLILEELNILFMGVY